MLIAARGRLAPALLLLPALGACAGGPSAPPPPGSRTVAAPAEAVRQRLAAAIRELGLSPRLGGTDLRATTGNPIARGWAACPRQLIENHDDVVRRADWTSPGASQGEVQLGLRPAGAGTEVRVTTRFAATYLDRFHYLPVTFACPSTGGLEQRLLDAATDSQPGAPAQ